MHYDVIIIGAGPAGLSAGLELQQQQKSVLVIEASNQIANTIQNYAPGKLVMSEPTSLTNRSPLPFDSGTREEVLAIWQEIIEQQQLNIEFNRRLSDVIHGDQGFQISTDDGSFYQCEKLVIAIGEQATPNYLDCPGSNHPNIATQVNYQEFMLEQAIAIVGSGDCAIEDALYLADDNRVTLLTRGEHFSKANAVNRMRIERAIQAGKVNHVPHAQIQRVEDLQRQQKTLELQIRRGSKILSLTTDRVITRIGTLSPRRFLESLGIRYDAENMRELPEANEHGVTHIRDLYLIGAVSGKNLIKLAINQGYNCARMIIGKPVAPLDMEILNRELSLYNAQTNVGRLAQRLREKRGLFYRLDTPFIARFLSQGNVNTYQKNELILEAGQHNDQIFFIVAGKIQVTDGNGLKKSIGSSQIFGEMTLVNQSPSELSYSAQEDTITINIQKSQFESLFAQHPAFRKRFVQSYWQRLLGWSLAPNAPERLLRILQPDTHTLSWNSGDILVTERDGLERCIFIVQGGVTVTSDISDDIWLGPGDMIESPENMVEHNVRFRATTSGIGISVPREDFSILAAMNQKKQPCRPTFNLSNWQPENHYHSGDCDTKKSDCQNDHQHFVLEESFGEGKVSFCR